MSVSFVNRVVDLVIPNGQTDSNVITADYGYGDAAAIGIGCVVANAGTVVIKVSVDDGTTWFTYQEGTPLAAALVPSAGNATTYLGLVAFRQIKLTGGSASTGASTFQMSTHITVGAGLA